MKLGITIFLAGGLGVCAFGQTPDPPHLIDPNLTIAPSLEGTRTLVLPKGLTQLSFGVQSKRGDDRRDEDGNPFHLRDRRFPDFRYTALHMGWGLGRGLEVSFNLPYIWTTDPLESPANFYSRSNQRGQILERCNGCTGISDVWGTLRWQPVRRARVPFVIQGDFKFPEVYRHSNPYLGSRRHDFQLSTWTLLGKGNVWVSPKLGYVWRGGDFSNALTYLGEAGWRPFGARRARGFYVRVRMDGSVAAQTGQSGARLPRYAGRRQAAPGRYYTLNDFEGHRATVGAGFVLAEWNFEVSYARWLAWRNGIGFKEWSLAASRPLARREFIAGDRVIAAPTQAEARTREPNSIVLAPGDMYVSTVFDWKQGQDRHDDRGRGYRAADGRKHDFRFLTAAVAWGLPKGFELDVLVPYLWGKEAFENVNNNFSHTGLNDIWISLRKQVLRNSALPLGVAAEFKFPEAIRHADRWLGELRHDIMLSVFTAKSGRNWWVAPKFSYRWREGAFSDELPYVAEGGWRPPFSHRLRDLYGKVVFDGNFSLKNATPAGPQDRFGDRTLAVRPDYYFTFNEGVMHRFGYGGGVRLAYNWNLEIVRRKYLWWANNNGYERDWTVGLSRWF